MAGQPYGMQAMLKEGHEMHDEPVMKNIVAAKELSNICRSSMGPNGEGGAHPPPACRIPAGPHHSHSRLWSACCNKKGLHGGLRYFDR